MRTQAGRRWRSRASHLMLQRREADEAQEELSSWRHGHGGVHSCQALCGRHQVLPQALDSFSWSGWRRRRQAQLVKVSRGLFLNVVTSGSNRRRQPRQTFIPLEKFEQSAYRSYGRGHVGIFSHPRPEVLHQLWSRHMWFRAIILQPHMGITEKTWADLPSSFILKATIASQS